MGNLCSCIGKEKVTPCDTDNYTIRKSKKRLKRIKKNNKNRDNTIDESIFEDEIDIYK